MATDDLDHTTPAAAGTVGRVIGTEDATPLEYWVGIADDQFLQLDDGTEEEVKMQVWC